jgi:4-amino-4-deoxy-L-arabinose transferase-like glycosyltransferase
MSRTRKLSLSILIPAGIILGILAYFGSINYLTLRGSEQRSAVVSFEMMQNKNYAVPTLFGWKYYNKPPVYNWLIIITSKIAGQFNHWTVRLPSLLSLLLLILINYYFVRKFLKADIAEITTILLVMNVELLFYGSVYTGEVDLFYSLIIYLQAISIFYFGSRRKLFDMFLVSYTLCAIGILTKGLPSLAFQFFGLIAWVIASRNLKILFSWKHAAGILLLVVLLSVYFFIYSMYDDPWPYIHKLLLESSERTLQGKHILQIVKAILLFPAQLAKVLLPGIIFVVFFQKSTFFTVYKKSKFLKFIAWFIILNLPVYGSTPSFKLRYIYMFLPFITTFLGLLYITGRKQLPKINSILEKIFLAVIILFCMVYISSYFINFTDNRDHTKWILTCILFMSILSIFLYIKYDSSRLYLLTLTFLLFRIYLNCYYFPDFHARHSASREFITKIMSLTKNEPVYYAGNSSTLFIQNTLTNRLAHKKMIEIKEVPVIPLQIPYYLGLDKNQILKFVEETREGEIYISKKNYIENKSVFIMAETDECLGNCEGYVLYKLKPEKNEIVP